MEHDANSASAALLNSVGKPHAYPYGHIASERAELLFDRGWPAENRDSLAGRWLSEQWAVLRGEYERFGYEPLRQRMEDLQGDIDSIDPLRWDIARSIEGMAAVGWKVREEIARYGEDTPMDETLAEWDASLESKREAETRGWEWQTPVADGVGFERLGGLGIKLKLEGDDENPWWEFYLSTATARQTWGWWLGFIQRRVNDELPTRLHRLHIVRRAAELQRDLISDLLYEVRTFGLLRSWEERGNVLWGARIEEPWLGAPDKAAPENSPETDSVHEGKLKARLNHDSFRLWVRQLHFGPGGAQRSLKSSFDLAVSELGGHPFRTYNSFRNSFYEHRCHVPPDS